MMVLYTIEPLYDSDFPNSYYFFYIWPYNKESFQTLLNGVNNLLCLDKFSNVPDWDITLLVDTKKTKNKK